MESKISQANSRIKWLEEMYAMEIEWAKSTQMISQDASPRIEDLYDLSEEDYQAAQSLALPEIAAQHRGAVMIRDILA